jgi:hypothetical protein
MKEIANEAHDTQNGPRKKNYFSTTFVLFHWSVIISSLAEQEDPVYAFD